jgi:EmrB/QacA subfamily drug resistance transporter
MTDLAPLNNRQKWLALALLATTQFVIVLDAAIVNVALPTIGADLRFSQDDLAWVVNAYVLTFGGFLLLGGRLADVLGRRRMFIGGLFIFAVASLLGGLSASEGELIVARGLQGFGGAMLAPAALSMVTTTFVEGAERNKALGVWGAVSGSGGAAGVLLGGVLTEYLGWEWVFLVNVPIAVVAALLAPRMLRESRRESENKRTFDVLGAVTVTGALALLVFALVDANRAAWESTQTIGLLIVSMALMGAFVVVERRSAAPLVPFRIFRSRTLTGSNITALLIGAALFSMFFFISLYMQQVLQYDALKAGVAYLPLALFIIISAGLASQLVTRVGFKPVLVVGMTLIAIALLWFSRVSVGGGYVRDILGPSIIAAIGLGLAFVPVTIGAVSGVSSQDSGLASGLINTAQQVGGALGLAVLSAVANHVTAGSRDLVELTDGFRSAFLVGSGIAVLGIFAAVLLIRSADSPALVGADPAALPMA